MGLVLLGLLGYLGFATSQRPPRFYPHCSRARHGGLCTMGVRWGRGRCHLCHGVGPQRAPRLPAGRSRPFPFRRLACPQDHVTQSLSWVPVLFLPAPCSFDVDLALDPVSVATPRGHAPSPGTVRTPRPSPTYDGGGPTACEPRPPPRAAWPACLPARPA